MKKILLLAVLMIQLTSCPSRANELRTEDISEEQFKKSILSLIVSRRSYGKNLQSEILGSANVELWDISKKILYISTPKSLQSNVDLYKAIAIDRASIQEAKIDGNSLSIDGKHLTRTNEKYNLFSLKTDGMNLQKNKEIILKFKEFTYQATLKQIAMFVNNDSVIGGNLRVSKAPEGIEKPKFLNHGAMVTSAGEPTLSNLVNQIINKNSSQAKQIQSALDFVTEHIKYDEKEFYFGREFLQRFSETLLAREGDCSNKSILLASMLEQIEVDYLLVYTPNHIYVAVPKQGFDDENKYEFKFNEKTWVPAETTLKGFRIGKTLIQNDAALKDIKFIQNPKLKNQIFSYPNEKIILFN